MAKPPTSAILPGLCRARRGTSSTFAVPSPNDTSTALPSTTQASPRRSVIRRYPWALLMVPTSLVVVVDLARRGGRILDFDKMHAGSYALACLESVIVWGSLLLASARRERTSWLHRVLFVALATFAIGGQLYFFEQYNAYLNFDVSVFATDFSESVISQLSADLPNYLLALLVPLLGALCVLRLARQFLPATGWPSRVAAWISPPLLVGSFFTPTQHRHVQASG